MLQLFPDDQAHSKADFYPKRLVVVKETKT